MKRFLSIYLVIGLLLGTSALLAACGNKALKLESDINEQMLLSETYFVDNVYSKIGNLELNLSTSEDYVADENLYVKISSEVEEEIKSITLGETLYTKGENVSVKVNEQATLTRFPFKVDDEALYISSVLMFLNLGNDGKLVIAFPENKLDKIVIDYYDSNNRLGIDVQSRAAETLFEINAAKLEYKFQSNSPDGEIFVVLKNGSSTLLEGQKALVLTVANPAKTNQSTSYKFETTTTPTGEEESGVLLFPGYNGGQDYSASSPANHKLIFNIYVPEIGVRRIVINFENTFSA